ncbi:hypothetical protein BV22DRAFT_1041640 [Leucogyrophana mollusca]|uniref:Uncharacterized protein n=1 Tax=Leucogyrophana mollusca TaxID=85980 RepID=A0ACB8AYW4_9AGAM|nr:hypothetical protein BV22DRAFT_1041640 [Leucogyrophana mollusca]
MQLIDLNQDIIFYILDNVHIKHKPGASYTEQPDLASLARTCRALRDPALNVLWRTQNSLVPLVSTLPEGAWEIREDTSDVWSGDLEFIFLTRPLLPSDWERFFIYAPRVKHLFVGRANSIGPDWKGVHHSTLCTLFESCPAPRLLPNLCSFEIYTPSWILGSKCDLSIFRSCLSTMLNPTLRTLKFEAAFDGKMLHSILDAISRCRQLDELAIEETSNDLLLTNVHPGLAHLRSFNSGQNYRILLSLNAVFAVGTWSRLVELEITISEDITPEDLMLRGSQGEYFPALRRLFLYTYAHRLIPPFIASVRSTQMEEIHFDVYATFTPATLPEVYNCLARHVDTLTHLQSFSVNVLEVVKSKKPNFLSSTSIFTPLFPLRKLRTVKILSRRLSTATVVTAADVAVMPQAWPNLEVLDVCMFRSRHVTLSTVADLADRCPRLWQLCIYVDATSVPDISIELPVHSSCGTRTPARLRILEVADSPVRDLARVAAFLAQRLPSVRKISFRRKYESEWEYICDHMTTGCRTRLRWQEDSDDDEDDES